MLTGVALFLFYALEIAQDKNSGLHLFRAYHKVISRLYD
jgi:hypothetical protein